MTLTRINPQISGKNLLHNPTFRYWQRDTYFTPAHSFVDFFHGYTADRWFLEPMTGSTILRREKLSGSDPMFDETPNSKYFLQWEGYSSGGSIDMLAQGVNENVDPGDAFDVPTWFTLSFWARTNSGNPTMWVALRRMFNENDWNDGGLDVAAKSSFQLSTSWQKFEITFKTNSRTGSPSNYSFKNMRLEFFKRMQSFTALQYGISSFDSGTFDLHITNIKLELGQEATPLVYDPDTDLVGCLRYFQKSWPLDVPVGTATNGGPYWSAVNGDNSIIASPGQLWTVPPRFISDKNLGGLPANSRFRIWAHNSNAIDRVYALSDGLPRLVTDYQIRPNQQYVTAVGTPLSDWFQANWAADFELWF